MQEVLTPHFMQNRQKGDSEIESMVGDKKGIRELVQAMKETKTKREKVDLLQRLKVLNEDLFEEVIRSGGMNILV